MKVSRHGILPGIWAITSILILVLAIALVHPAKARTSPQSASLVKVQKLLSDKLGLAVEDLQPDTDLIQDLRQDRTQVYYVILEIYKELGIKYSNASFTRVGDIARVVERFSAHRKKKQTRSLTRGASKKVTPPPAAFSTRSVTRSPLAKEAASESESEAAASANSYLQTVFYATNRGATGESDPESYYGGDRAKSGSLAYGVARVNIPKTHKPGQLETPWMRWMRDESSHIFIKTLTPLRADGFFSRIDGRSGQQGRDRDILLYLHGFNVSFDEAIRRAAQIAFDFSFKGTTISFSWPSDGVNTAYASDREDAMWSVKYFETFLEQLKRRYPGRKIHLIAHSMGNQVLLNALRGIAYKGMDHALLGSVILAAPDFDAGLFEEQIGGEIRHLAERWTIYASKNDYALWLSEKINATRRLGTPLTLVEGYNIIDASELEVTPWNLPENHSYYATKQVLLRDMIAVLKGLGPQKRGLKPFANGALLFWRFP